MPFEIKAAKTVSADDVRGIRRWQQTSGRSDPGMVLYAGDEVKPLAKGVWALPLRGTVPSPLPLSPLEP